MCSGFLASFQKDPPLFPISTLLLLASVSSQAVPSLAEIAGECTSVTHAVVTVPAYFTDAQRQASVPQIAR